MAVAHDKNTACRISYTVHINTYRQHASTVAATQSENSGYSDFHICFALIVCTESSLHHTQNSYVNV